MKKCSQCKEFRNCRELCDEKEAYVSDGERKYLKHRRERFFSAHGIIIASDKEQIERYLDIICERIYEGDEELKKKVANIILELRPKYQKAINLRFKFNRTFASISKRLGYKVHTSARHVIKNALTDIAIRISLQEPELIQRFNNNNNDKRIIK